MYENSITQSNNVPFAPGWTGGNTHRFSTCLVLLCFVCLASWSSRASAERWVGKDKALHFAVSMGLGSGAYGALWLCREKSGDDRLVRLLFSSSALLPGIAKEIYDAGQRGGQFSEADLVWDVIGVAVGAGAAFLLERFLSNSSVSSVTVGGVVVPGGGSILVVFRPFQ